jgi:hypothetical protein
MTNADIERGISSLDKYTEVLEGQYPLSLTVMTKILRDVLTAMKSPDINRKHIDDLHRKQMMTEDRLARLEEQAVTREYIDRDTKLQHQKIEKFCKDMDMVIQRVVKLEYPCKHLWDWCPEGRICVKCGLMEEGVNKSHNFHTFKDIENCPICTPTKPERSDTHAPDPECPFCEPERSEVDDCIKSTLGVGKPDSCYKHSPDPDCPFCEPEVDEDPFETIKKHAKQIEGHKPSAYYSEHGVGIGKPYPEMPSAKWDKKQEAPHTKECNDECVKNNHVTCTCSTPKSSVEKCDTITISRTTIEDIRQKLESVGFYIMADELKLALSKEDR